MKSKNLETIGSTTLVTIEGISDVPAKIDTGADSSSVHVENLEMSKDGILSFNLFEKSGKKISTKNYRISVVRSSNGAESIRYCVPLSLKIGKKRIRANFSLTDRSKNNFPVLIGRRTINGKFLVDVSIREVSVSKNPKSTHLTSILRENPLHFHEKYIKVSKIKEN